MKKDILSKNMVDGVVSHMNDDHLDACLAIVQTLGAQPDAIQATMSGMDSLGADFIAHLADGSHKHTRVTFEKPISREAQVRGHLVAMTKRAREAAAQ